MMTVRPRILYVSAVSEFKGGAEAVMRTMLANPLVQPVLAVPEEGALGAAAQELGVPVCYYRPSAMLRVHRPPRPLPMMAAVADAVRCAWRLRTLARAHGCHIVHTNGLKPHLLAALLGAFTDTRTLAHVHDIPYRASERAIWRLIARCVDQFIMVSRPCFPADALPRNVRIVRNGIRPICESLDDRRAAVPLRLGFVGRFHPNKGLDLLLDWLGAVRSHGIDATLAIRGRPDPDMPEYWDRIRQRIETEGLAPFIMQQGWRTGAETYRDLDVLLVPSNIPDPAPLVVLEAMGAGVVVAGYPAGGIPDMIEHGRTGLLASDGDALATALQGLVAEPAAFAAMRAAAHEAIRTDFSIAGFYRRLLDVYNAVLRSDADGANLPAAAAAAGVPETR